MWAARQGASCLATAQATATHCAVTRSISPCCPATALICGGRSGKHRLVAEGQQCLGERVRGEDGAYGRSQAAEPTPCHTPARPPPPGS
jgi:hypothetical protein